MHSNPILKALKSRTLGPFFAPEDNNSVSSHGSAQASLPSSVKPGDHGGRSKSRWNPSERQPIDAGGYKKELTRKSVEDWLWDERSRESASSLSGDLVPEEPLSNKSKEKDVPLFDLSKKDLAMAATFPSQSTSSKSTSSTPWTDDGSVKEEERHKPPPSPIIKEQQEPPPAPKGISIGQTSDGPSLEEDMSPMFKSFVDHFKNGSLSFTEEFSSSSSSSHSEMSSPSPDESSYDASCLGNITCDISATSSEVFWGQTYTWYRSENKAHRRRRELEDEGSVIHYMDSLRELRTKATSENFEIPDFIFDQPSLINDVFQDRSEEGGLILSFEDETDDERSSGYIGSEERSQSRPSSSTALNEADITFISTKLYRQALGKRRRHFTASSSSSSYSTNTSTPQRVSSPNASYESLLTNLLLPNAGQKGPPLPAAP